MGTIYPVSFPLSFNMVFVFVFVFVVFFFAQCGLLGIFIARRNSVQVVGVDLVHSCSIPGQCRCLLKNKVVFYRNFFFGLLQSPLCVADLFRHPITATTVLSFSAWLCYFHSFGHVDYPFVNLQTKLDRVSDSYPLAKVGSSNLPIYYTPVCSDTLNSILNDLPGDHYFGHLDPTIYHFAQRLSPVRLYASIIWKFGLNNNNVVALLVSISPCPFLGPLESDFSFVLYPFPTSFSSMNPSWCDYTNASGTSLSYLIN